MLGVAATAFAFLCALLFAMTASLRVRTTVLTWFTMLQPRIPGSPLSAQALLALATLPTTISSLKIALRIPTLVVIILMLPVQLTALFYSPDPMRGLRRISALLVVVVLLLLLIKMLRDERDPLLTIMGASSPLVIATAASTVLFRVNPALELAYLQGPVARALLGDAATDLFTTAPNNVLYTYKAGGLFFLNGNQASLYLGLAMLGCAAAFFSTRHRRWIFLGLFVSVGIVAAGSKTGLLLMILLPAIGVLLWATSRSRARALWIVPIVGLAVLASAFGSDAVSFLSGGVDESTGRVDDATETFGTRLRIWELASGLWLSSPLLGLGFGGWDPAFVTQPLAPSFTRVFPPHNVVITAWAEAGLLNAILVVLFFVLSLTAGLRQAFMVDSDAVTRGRSIVATLIITWTLLHGLADNTDIWGTPHCMPIVALAVVMCVLPGAKNDQPVSRHTPSSAMTRQRSR